MMDIDQVRYMFEHSLLPQWYFQEGMNLIGGLITEKDFLYKLMKKTCEDNDVVMPYPKELFLFEQFKTEDKILGGKITMPTPNEMPGCHMIYLLFNLQFDKIAFFTVERGQTEADLILGEWTREGQHLNHGKVDVSGQGALDRVIGIYRSRK